MLKQGLRFYNEYESFYSMAKKSKCFEKYCLSAYGADFSQDGFSDVAQVNLILDYIHKGSYPYILDIGCGNGKMVKYLQSQTGGHISGFDFSENAIQTACADNTANADFKVGVMGEIDYPTNTFDLITSMDTIYFAQNLNSFIGKVYTWLKDRGVFFIGYQEGDVMAKTATSETTTLAKALNANNFKYEVIDYTKQTYDMLIQKRKTTIQYRDDFLKENLQDWYSIILNQTNCISVSYEQYKRNNARYIFIAKKL